MFKRKGGGGQRPFEQCSKKLHFSYGTASLKDWSFQRKKIKKKKRKKGKEKKGKEEKKKRGREEKRKRGKKGKEKRGGKSW